MSLQQRYKQFNKHVETCCASGRSCPPNHTVRNVWRAPCPDTFSVPVHLLVRLVGIHSAKVGSVEHLGRACGCPVRQGRPRTPEKVRLGTIWPAKVPHGCPPDLTSVCLRLHPDLRFAISSVGGSAMHMERPDDVGREAGIGRTRNGKEPTIFRACPC